MKSVFLNYAARDLIFLHYAATFFVFSVIFIAADVLLGSASRSPEVAAISALAYVYSYNESKKK